MSGSASFCGVCVVLVVVGSRDDFRAGLQPFELCLENSWGDGLTVNECKLYELYDCTSYVLQVRANDIKANQGQHSVCCADVDFDLGPKSLENHSPPLSPLRLMQAPLPQVSLTQPH